MESQELGHNKILDYLTLQLPHNQIQLTNCKLKLFRKTKQTTIIVLEIYVFPLPLFLNNIMQQQLLTML